MIGGVSPFPKSFFTLVLLLIYSSIHPLIIKYLLETGAFNYQDCNSSPMFEKSRVQSSRYHGLSDLCYRWFGSGEIIHDLQWQLETHSICCPPISPLWFLHDSATSCKVREIGTRSLNCGFLVVIPSLGDLGILFAICLQLAFPFFQILFINLFFFLVDLSKSALA